MQMEEFEKEKNVEKLNKDVNRPLARVCALANLVKWSIHKATHQGNCERTILKTLDMKYIKERHADMAMADVLDCEAN